MLLLVTVARLWYSCICADKGR